MEYKLDVTTNKHSWKNNTKRFIIIHHTGWVSSLESMTNYLAKNPEQVSAHYVIDKEWDISRIWTDDYVLWHAGRWDLIPGYIDNINYHSIGIEVISDGNNFTKSQIDSLAVLVRDIQDRNNITTENIIRHKDYSTRKWDIWDWFFQVVGYTFYNEWLLREIDNVPEDKTDYQKYLERGIIENPDPERVLTEKLYWTLREREIAKGLKR